MKVQLFLPLTIVVSVALMAVMKTRKQEEAIEDKRNMFVGIKLRVTNDVLGEYQAERTETKKLLEKAQRDLETLEEEVNTVWMTADKAKGDLEMCQGDQKLLTDEIAVKESDLRDLQELFETERATWQTEAETLKKQLAARSSVCEFVMKGSPPEASTLCSTEGIVEAPKQQEPKAEAPKQAEQKAEAPKQEEQKAEAPKQEEPKAEAPKQEEPKAEAPKQVEQKAEAPKQEEQKAEAPKQEEPQGEAPKQEVPQAEAPKQ